MTGSIRLYAEDVAKLWNMSVRRARSRLMRLEAEYGSDMVGREPARNGVRRFTTEGALAKVDPAANKLEARVFALEDRIQRLEERFPRQKT